MNNTYIYLITNINNCHNSVYIGKTKNIKTRKNHHIKKYGKNINYSVIDKINSLKREDWEPLESYWIEQFKCWGFNLINKNKGGGGPLFKTLESRQKQSISLLGKSKPLNHGLHVSLANKGISKHTKKSKQKISIKNSHPQTIVKCSYCLKQGGIIAMKRWHFNKCKNYDSTLYLDRG
jgi:hypothetical protein